MNIYKSICIPALLIFQFVEKILISSTQTVFIYSKKRCTNHFRTKCLTNTNKRK